MANHENERRKFMRIPFHAAAEINAHLFSCRTESGIDVSMSGLHMNYNGTVPAAGSICVVTLYLHPDDERITIDAAGKIVRSEPGSIAVEFTGLDPDSLHHLRQLILNNADDPEKAESEFDARWSFIPQKSS